MTKFDGQCDERGARLIGATEALVPSMQAHAGDLDRASAFPAEDLAALKAAGVFTAPLPERVGGLGAGTEPGGAGVVLALLCALGRGNAALARIWEAHVNALRLVVRYGTEQQVEQAADQVLAGELFGLWVTDPAGRPGLTAEHGRLVGGKGPCSGAGHCTRALVTVQTPEGTRMAVAGLSGGERVTHVQGMLGMRAARNGFVELDGVTHGPWLGAPGDYMREPDFSTGAWRSSAAAAGVLDALVEATRTALIASGRGEAALQLARFGAMIIAQETARLWTREAAHRAEHASEAAAQVAYVNFARLAVERACLDAIELAQRSLGLAAFVAPHPVERLCRDLATYLRQPAADAVLLEAAAWQMARA